VTPLRGLLFLAGVLGIVLLVSRLPDDVFATTQTMLVVTAGALFLGVAAAAFLAPARRLLGKLFTFAPREDTPTWSAANEAEWRGLARVVLAGAVCMAVAGLPGLLR
jgi:hypothetical protein